MSRIRTIKPEFWTSEQIAKCSRDARLLFIGMWNFADDGGVIPASAMRTKGQILPFDDLSAKQVEGMVRELLAVGLLSEFTGDDGEAYWFITGFAKHQRIHKPAFKYPNPKTQIAVSTKVVPKNPSQSATFRNSSPPEGKGREVEGKGGDVDVEVEPELSGQGILVVPGAGAPDPGTPCPQSQNGCVDEKRNALPLKATRSREHPPELFILEDWLQACRCADLVEYARNTSSKVEGKEQNGRAIAFCYLVESGKVKWAECIRALELAAKRTDARVIELLDGLRQYPDGAYPGNGNREGQFCRIEQLVKLTRRVAPAQPIPAAPSWGGRDLTESFNDEETAQPIENRGER